MGCEGLDANLDGRVGGEEAVCQSPPVGVDPAGVTVAAHLLEHRDHRASGGEELSSVAIGAQLLALGEARQERVATGGGDH